MLFRNYNIVIYKDKEGGSRTVRMRGWLGFFFLLGGIFSIALNVYLWGYYTRVQELHHEVDEGERIIQEQQSQMLGFSVRLDELAENLHRIQRFDARLRVLMNVDKGPGETQGESSEGSISSRASLFGGPQVLMQHRELYVRHALSLASDLNSQVHLEEVTQQKLLLYLRENKEMLLATPSIWPVNGRVTSGFGYRKSPFGGKMRLHKGIDIANKIGTPVWVTARGMVTFAAFDNAYGNTILVDHGNNIVTRYAHLSKILVRTGQYVQRGDVIGAIGTTGRSTGPHLHYEVHLSGVPVNPIRYILN